ncbi:MAG: hypothetical protein ACI9UA_002742 [Pseudoalteromonas tetraodonis]|jgi:hypothetical protein
MVEPESEVKDKPKRASEASRRVPDKLGASRSKLLDQQCDLMRANVHVIFATALTNNSPDLDHMFDRCHRSSECLGKFGVDFFCEGDGRLHVGVAFWAVH